MVFAGSRSTGRSALVPKPGTLVKVPASGTTQLVPIQVSNYPLLIYFTLKYESVILNRGFRNLECFSFRNVSFHILPVLVQHLLHTMLCRK